MQGEGAGGWGVERAKKALMLLFTSIRSGSTVQLGRGYLGHKAD